MYLIYTISCSITAESVEPSASMLTKFTFLSCAFADTLRTNAIE